EALELERALDRVASQAVPRLELAPDERPERLGEHARVRRLDPLEQRERGVRVPPSGLEVVVRDERERRVDAREELDVVAGLAERLLAARGGLLGGARDVEHPCDQLERSRAERARLLGSDELFGEPPRLSRVAGAEDVLAEREPPRR